MLFKQIICICLLCGACVNRSWADAISELPVCGDYDLRDKQSLKIWSPNYDTSFALGYGCLYKIVAPLYHKVKAVCEAIIGDGNDAYCQKSPNDGLFFQVDGSMRMDSGNRYQTCRYYANNSYYPPLAVTSLYNSLAFAYNLKQVAGRFSCTISVFAENSCDCGWSLDQRIVGGYQAGPNTVPFMAALQRYQNRDFFCGAIIISTNMVVSAAHCVDSMAPSAFNVSVGRNDITKDLSQDTYYSRTYTVEWVKLHPSYKSDNDNYDIALIKTVRFIHVSKGVVPVCLPSPYEGIKEYDGKEVYFSGWGTTEFAGRLSPKLLVTNVNCISNADCKKTYANMADTNICTFGNGRDGCQYDSGGPIYYKNKTIGRYVCVGIQTGGISCGTAPAFGMRFAPAIKFITANSPGDAYYCQYF